MITDNEMIYLDVSTTVNFIAEFLKAKQVTIVTNSIDSAYDIGSIGRYNHTLFGRF